MRKAINTHLRKAMITIMFGGWFAVVAQNNIEEEVYLHLSSNQVLSGESLYYSAFVRSKQTGKVSLLSKLLYLEIVNESAVSVHRKKISLENGRGSGEFFVPSHLPTGKYAVVAYTRWMKNFKTYYRDEIEIINPYLKYDELEDTIHWSVQAFPEGGHLIGNVSQKLVVESKDQYGAPVSARLEVWEDGFLKDTLVTDAQGRLGLMVMLPKKNVKLRMISDHGDRDVSLPIICADCYALSLVPSREQVSFRVLGSGTSMDRFDYEITYAGKVVRKATFSGSDLVTLSREELPAGLLRIRLLKDELIQSERLMWNGVRLSSREPIGQFAMNSRVELALPLSEIAWGSVTILHEMDHPSQRTMSYGHSIQQLIDQKETNLFYQNATDAELDLMLITAKYREYDNPPIYFLPEYRSDLLEGQLVTLSGNPVAGASVGLSLAGSPTQIDYGKTDSLGFFLLDLKFMDKVYEATFNVISPENQLLDQVQGGKKEERFVLSEQADQYQVKFRIVDFEGKPVRNAELKLGTSTDTGSLNYETDEEGYAVLNLDLLDRLDRASFEMIPTELIPEPGLVTSGDKGKEKDFISKGRTIAKATVLEIEGRYQIKVIDEFVALPTTPMKPVSLSPEKLEEVRRRSIHSQIENAYYYSDTTSEVVDYQLPQFEIFQSYKLDDYTRFPSLRDTFIEFISGVRVSKNLEKHKVKMWNAEWVENINYATSKTVYLLNGRFITSEEMLKTSPYLIEKVDVINRQFAFGSIIFNGVISLSTFDLQKTTEPSSLDYDFIPCSATQSVLLDGLLKKDREREPDYRELLYWNPQFRGGDQITFTTSSVPGTYVVRVEGVTETGEAISRSFEFEVKQ